ncbi:MAG: nucleotidyltransferase family protein [Gammaproteobacteria bacterium]|nr:nucleotidyltransferase family protein [Gammaproteobacteria bacterium]MBU1777902.1 nucleotidyltransferase family protein [Gammaproteobacteria bacterium]MBU1968125.1 nucleotidyltransferase family protein [Gammaproteobacteria bacterium]
MLAMILAAGRGERMRPLTDHTPKPLLQAGGKPLIVWHIERLVRAGITDLVINHAHLGKQIEQTLGDGSRFGAHIRYSDEGTALETAGGIAFALHLLGEQPFAVVNGDIWCDFDFSHLPPRAAALANSADMAHLVLVDNPEHNPKGDFGLQAARVTDMGPKFTFSGIGLYKPSLFANIARGSKAPLAPLLREQIAAGHVSGEHYHGRWMDIGTPQRLDELDKQLRETQNARHD